MPVMHAFITGTDTGVGKTFVTALLIRALRAKGVDAVGFKPICCGGRDDAEILRSASADALTLNEVNPVWLRTPAAPYVAAMIENRIIDLALIREVYAELRSRHAAVLVEGVGGWLVPILHGYLVADLARDLDLPAIVVVANRLGALNHAALTFENMRHRGSSCLGLIMNEMPGPGEPATDIESTARATNSGVLEDWLGVPILHQVGLGQSALKV
jgi:dethiobiotin synthetase